MNEKGFENQESKFMTSVVTVATASEFKITCHCSRNSSKRVTFHQNLDPVIF